MYRAALVFLVGLTCFGQGVETWVTVPKTLKSDDIVQVCRALDVKKGEFESTDAFEARQAKLIPETGLSFVFVSKSNTFNVNYFADAQEFNLELKDGIDGLDMYSQIVKGKEYIGTNGFGVKKRIHDLNVLRWSIIPMQPGGDPAPKPTIIFPCPSTLAPKVKQDLGVLVIGHTPSNIWPLMDPEDYHDGATIDDPVNYYSHTIKLALHIDRIVVYQKSNFKVLNNTNPYASVGEGEETLPLPKPWKYKPTKQ